MIRHADVRENRHADPGPVVGAFMRAFSAYWAKVQPVLKALASTPRHRTIVAARAVGLEWECREALTRLDAALDDAEADYQTALAAELAHWRNVGQHAMRWQLWAALTPGLTWQDVASAAHLCLRNRVACDWTQEEAAEVVAGLVEGWLSR